MFKKIFSISIASCCLLFFAFVAMAQTDGAEEKPKVRLNFPQLLGSSYNNPETAYAIDIADYIGALYQYAVSIVGLVAVAMIMIGGVIWLTAGGSAGRVDQAKEMISNAVAGLLIAIFSFTILQTINPALTRLEVPKIQTVDRVETKSALPWCPDEQKYACGVQAKTTQGADCMGQWCADSTQDCYNKTDKSTEAFTSASFGCVNVAKCQLYEKQGGCTAIHGLSDIQNFCVTGACVDFIGACKSQATPTRYTCEEVDAGMDCEADKDCKKGEICKADGECGSLGYTGYACDADRECENGICNLDENRCAPPGGEPGGEPCDRNEECASKLCNKAWASDQCVPVGGEPIGAECNHNEECASKQCVGDGIMTDGTCR